MNACIHCFSLSVLEYLVNNTWFHSLCLNYCCHFCPLTGASLTQITEVALCVWRWHNYFNTFWSNIFYLSKFLPNVSECMSCSRNHLSLCHNRLTRFDANSSRQETITLHISISGKWELILFCAALSPPYPRKRSVCKYRLNPTLVTPLKSQDGDTQARIRTSTPRQGEEKPQWKQQN